jgi:hypothetical protein
MVLTLSSKIMPLSSQIVRHPYDEHHNALVMCANLACEARLMCAAQVQVRGRASCVGGRAQSDFVTKARMCVRRRNVSVPSHVLVTITCPASSPASRRHPALRRYLPEGPSSPSVSLLGESRRPAGH